MNPKFVKLFQGYATLDKVLRFVRSGGPATIVLYRGESPVAALH